MSRVVWTRTANGEEQIYQKYKIRRHDLMRYLLQSSTNHVPVGVTKEVLAFSPNRIALVAVARVFSQALSPDTRHNK